MQLVDDDGNTVAEGDVGEIQIRGQNVINGYRHRSDATANAVDAEGCFRTDDTARIDENGYTSSTARSSLGLVQIIREELVFIGCAGRGGRHVGESPPGGV